MKPADTIGNPKPQHCLLPATGTDGGFTPNSQSDFHEHPPFPSKKKFYTDTQKDKVILSPSCHEIRSPASTTLAWSASHACMVRVPCKHPPNTMQACSKRDLCTNRHRFISIKKKHPPGLPAEVWRTVLYQLKNTGLTSSPSSPRSKRAGGGRRGTARELPCPHR